MHHELTSRRSWRMAIRFLQAPHLGSGEAGLSSALVLAILIVIGLTGVFINSQKGLTNLRYAKKIEFLGHLEDIRRYVWQNLDCPATVTLPANVAACNAGNFISLVTRGPPVGSMTLGPSGTAPGKIGTRFLARARCNPASTPKTIVMEVMLVVENTTTERTNPLTGLRYDSSDDDNGWVDLYFNASAAENPFNVCFFP